MEQAVVEHVESLLGLKQDRALRAYLLELGPDTVAEVIDNLERGRRKCFALLPPELQASVILALSEDDKAYIMERLPDAVIARFLHFCAEDDATDLVQHLREDKRAEVLSRMVPDRKKKIETLLAFGSETAGGLMDLNFVVVRATAAPQEILKTVRKETRAGHPPVILVSERGRKVAGIIAARSLLLARPAATAGSLMQPLPVVPHGLDREHLLDLLSKSTAQVACVTNEKDDPLGVIHLHDLLKVAEAEATEDVYRFAGVAPDERPGGSVLSKVRLRSSWLVMNLGTAFLASLVVSNFQGSIRELALLAVFMPIVAGVGGNTATQSLAVVVRGLATGELEPARARFIIVREALAGAINGLGIGIIAAAASQLFGAPKMLSLVLGLAILLNMSLAGFIGSFVPFVLKKFGIDPAVASCVFVTPATDMCGFLAFLSLGTWLLL